MCNSKNNSSYANMGGYVISPEKVMTTKEITTDDKLMITTKYVYMLLRHLTQVSKIVGIPYKPTYTFMKKRYGVACDTYTNALKQLEQMGVVKIEYKSTPGGVEYLCPQVLEENYESFEKVPRVIITTSLLTVNQKIILCCVWKFLRNAQSDFSLLVTHFTSYQLAKEISKYGVCERTVYTVLKQLTEPSEGYITLLSKTPEGIFTLDTAKIMMLYEHELFFNTSKMFFKIKPHQFAIDDNEHRIVKL